MIFWCCRSRIRFRLHINKNIRKILLYYTADIFIIDDHFYYRCFLIYFDFILIEIIILMPVISIILLFILRFRRVFLFRYLMRGAARSFLDISIFITIISYRAYIRHRSPRPPMYGINASSHRVRSCMRQKCTYALPLKYISILVIFISLDIAF